MNLLRGIAAAVFFALCVALVIIGQTIRSPMGLLIMLLGLRCYHPQAHLRGPGRGPAGHAGDLQPPLYPSRPDRQKRGKSRGEGRREKIKPHPVMEHPAENHSRRVIWRLAQGCKRV